MALVTKIAAAATPIALADLKTYMGIKAADTNKDADLTRIIYTATERCEAYTGRAFINRTYTLWLDGFPAAPPSPGEPIEGVHQVPWNTWLSAKKFIILQRPPLVSVTHLKTYNTSDVDSTMSASDYFVDTKTEPGRLSLNDSATWPTTYLRPINGIEIEYIAGYGAAESNIPDGIQEALFQMSRLLFKVKTKDFNENDTPSFLEEAASGIPKGIKEILNPFKLINV